MFSAWLGQAGSAGPEAFRGVRLAVSGAAPLPREVLAAFRDRFGVTIWEGYGLTEAAPCVTTNALGPEARAGSIGLPLPGLEVRLVDEDGEDADEDDPGEIWVRGPNVFAGYWGLPEGTHVGPPARLPLDALFALLGDIDAVAVGQKLMLLAIVGELVFSDSVADLAR